MLKKKHTNIYEVLAQNYENDLVDNLKKFCAIDSVYDESTVSEENPFGKGVTNALKFVENLAKQDGFKVTNYNNKVIEIIAGEGKKNITMLAHADVVPVGTGWDQDPFKVVEKKGVFYGRGVADDKGPLLSSYYAMKLLDRNHLLGNYHVRLLVGGNEERGSACMHYYFDVLKKYQPDLGFSPDADFPLIFAEKGIIGFEVKKDLEIKGVYSIKGGIASNSVIEKCDVEMEDNPHFILYLKENKIKHTLTRKNGRLYVTFLGKAAHGSMPQHGINAGMIAISSLAFFYDHPELNTLAGCYNGLYGEGIDAYNESKDMGKNSMNVGIINYENNHLSMIINFRHVDGVNPDEIMKRIAKASEPFEIKELGRAPLLYYPKDSPLVSTLLRVYREETGDMKSEPLAIGGGTYAKDANNIVAYGLTFPGEDPKMHAVGENIKRSDLMKGVSIYAHAIVELGKLL